MISLLPYEVCILLEVLLVHDGVVGQLQRLLGLLGHLELLGHLGLLLHGGVVHLLLLLIFFFLDSSGRLPHRPVHLVLVRVHSLGGRQDMR